MFDEKAYLFIWPWSVQRIGNIRGKIWRALRNNNKEIRLDNEKAQMNGGKKCQNHII